MTSVRLHIELFVLIINSMLVPHVHAPFLYIVSMGKGETSNELSNVLCSIAFEVKRKNGNRIADFILFFKHVLCASSCVRI